MIYGDDACLDIQMPGRGPQGGQLCHQVTLLFEEEADAKV